MRNRPQRRGTTSVEAALVYPVVIVTVLGLLVGGMGIFRYQEVANLAREGARYAATHAGQYQQENAAAITAGTLPNVNDDYITKNIIKPRAYYMDTSKLQVSITINTPNGSFDWDSTSKNGARWPSSQETISNTNYNVTNTVSVTVTYPWVPEGLLVGPINLSSTSVIPMCY